jgi:tRNA 5-methylaminomethyl-2-thiouridine biosynthesis bifunctional protein
LIVIVVGAGIAGLSVARALAARGIRPVVIAPDHGHTRAGAGIVSAQFHDRRLARLARRSQDLLAGLVRAQRCGMAQIALSERTAACVARIEGGRDHLPRALAAHLAPGFRRRIAAVSWSDSELRLSVAELVAAMSRGCRRVRARADRIEGTAVRAGGRWYEGDRIVLAAGADLSRWMPGLALERRRAQVARVAAVPPAMVHVVDTGIYMRPGGPGGPGGSGGLAGDGDSPWRARHEPPPGQVTRSFLRELERRLGAMLALPPALGAARGGLVAWTVDRQPLSGRAGRGEGTWALGALGGDGLALAPALGEELVDRILAEGASPRISLPAGPRP